MNRKLLTCKKGECRGWKTLTKGTATKNIDQATFLLNVTKIVSWNFPIPVASKDKTEKRYKKGDIILSRENICNLSNKKHSLAKKVISKEFIAISWQTDSIYRKPNEIEARWTLCTAEEKTDPYLDYVPPTHILSLQGRFTPTCSPKFKC